MAATRMFLRAPSALLIACCLGLCGTDLWAGEARTPVYHDLELPDRLSLCGEAMPLGNPAVREMLDRELTVSAWQPEQVFMWIKRSGRAFPFIEKKLAELGLPDDLKYLAVAESALLPYIESNKGAAGTWQMIGETGVRNGLRKQELVDERLNPEIAAVAALGYLTKLQQEFGAWTLALAAYNCGEARMRREIDIQQVRDYYRLNLPLETERFVFRIAAIKLIMQDPVRYGYVIPKGHLYRPIDCEPLTVSLELPVPIADVSRATGEDFKVLKELNPELTGYLLPAGTYALKVPPGQAGKTKKAIAVLEQQLRQQKKDAPRVK